nr:hypothetical protein [bacterium]
MRELIPISILLIKIRRISQITQAVLVPMHEISQKYKVILLLIRMILTLSIILLKKGSILAAIQVLRLREN